MLDDLIRDFPALLECVLQDKKRESDLRNMTELAAALITSMRDDNNYDVIRAEDCVDRAKLLYERLQAKPDTAQDVINATGETRIRLSDIDKNKPHAFIGRWVCDVCGLPEDGSMYPIHAQR